MDDDVILRRALCSGLEEAGYEVIAAADGAAGLRLYRERSADLVLVDIFMPVMDGLEVILALRTADPRPKVIAISGAEPAGLGDILAIASALGADQTLRKPFAAHDLLALLRDVLGEA
jgi:CheY-like chemotaxis protein